MARSSETVNDVMASLEEFMGAPAKDWKPLVRAGDYCPKGWRHIVDPVLDELEAMGVTIAQVKSKFGGLRIYIDPCDDEATYAKAEELIAGAEADCRATCEGCGVTGFLRRSRGWLVTSCGYCNQKGT